VIEKKARIVYAALGGFEFVAASPPIAADRLISGTTFVAEVSESLVGFALKSRVTVSNASISTGLPCSASCNIDVLAAPSARALSNISSIGTVAGMPIASPIRAASPRPAEPDEPAPQR
jgi:hypothetical protein